MRVVRYIVLNLLLLLFHLFHTIFPPSRHILLILLPGIIDLCDGFGCLLSLLHRLGYFVFNRLLGNHVCENFLHLVVVLSLTGTLFNHYI